MGSRLLFWVILPAVAAACMCGMQCLAADLTAQEIAAKTLTAYYYPRDDAVVSVQMRLVNKEGKERLRAFTMLRLDKEDCGEQYFYAYFHNPPDVRRTVFMVWKHIDRDDDRWLYLPAIDLVKRISSNDKRSSFVGSDFTYEDVSGRHLLDDEHVLEGEKMIDGKSVYVIKSTPKDKESVEFSYRVLWADKETFLPVRLEHYDKRGQLYKVLETQTIALIQDTPTVTSAVMRNIETGQVSELRVSNVSYNRGLTKDAFEERYLRRPPRQWIQAE